MLKTKFESMQFISSKGLFKDEKNISNFLGNLVDKVIVNSMDHVTVYKGDKEYWIYNTGYVLKTETEFLIDKVLNFPQKPRSILELGTGTGCLILSLLKEIPKAKVSF